MARVILEEQILSNIANAIRQKNGETQTYYPGEMSNAIANLKEYVLKTKTINSNGVYPSSIDNADGYSVVTVNVSGGGQQVDTRTPIAAWNFKSLTPLVDTIGGKVLTNNGNKVTFDSNGAYFPLDGSSAAAYGLTKDTYLSISIEDLLGENTLAGCDIEVDVGKWNKWALKTADAGRFILTSPINGLAYRHTTNTSSCGWNIYDRAWTSANILSTMIDYSTVRLSLAASSAEYDEVYVNGKLVFSDTTTGNRLMDSAEFVALGGPYNYSSGNTQTGVGAIDLSAMRIYRRN